MLSINQIQTVIENSFIEPVGLLALVALLPLIIFYLIKRKPDKEIMPSMMFFMENKKSGKAHSALKKLKRNNLLFLHILLVGLMAGALAQPFIDSDMSSEEVVIVLDKSASMENQLDAAKNFVSSNTGSENTLIVLDNEPELVLDRASARQISSYMRDVEPTHLPGSIANGIEFASRYDGDIVIASDLQHSEGQRSPEEVVRSLRNEGRNVKLFEPDTDNSRGIIDINIDEDESSIDIKNFMDVETDATLQKDGQETTRTIEGGAVETVTVSTNPGKNVVSLNRDGFSPDNTAYISIPEDDSYEAVFITDNSNPYFEKALELIEFIDVETIEPPVDNVDADIYIIGPTENILSETVNEIEKEVENGASMIVFSHENVFDRGFNSLPVEESYNLTENTVDVTEPQITSFETVMLQTNKTKGGSYTSPEEGMIRSQHGEGQVFFYNIEDRNFNQRLTYPLLWKQVLNDLLDRPSIEELNLKTGDKINHSRIETPSGDVEEGLTEITEIGFYETENRIYAANLLNEDESYSEAPEIETDTGQEGTTEREIQNLVIMLIALLIIGELVYLRYIGEI